MNIGTSSYLHIEYRPTILYYSRLANSLICMKVPIRQKEESDYDLSLPAPDLFAQYHLQLLYNIISLYRIASEMNSELHRPHTDFGKSFTQRKKNY